MDLKKLFRKETSTVELGNHMRHPPPMQVSINGKTETYVRKDLVDKRAAAITLCFLAGGFFMALLITLRLQ